MSLTAVTSTLAAVLVSACPHFGFFLFWQVFYFFFSNSSSIDVPLKSVLGSALSHPHSLTG